MAHSRATTRVFAISLMADSTKGYKLPKFALILVAGIIHLCIRINAYLRSAASKRQTAFSLVMEAWSVSMTDARDMTFARCGGNLL